MLKYDPIAIFFLCWVIGFGGWWALLPQEALTQPSLCLDPQYVILSLKFYTIPPKEKSQFAHTSQRSKGFTPGT